jgi:hypothetical protein
MTSKEQIRECIDALLEVSHVIHTSPTHSYHIKRNKTATNPAHRYNVVAVNKSARMASSLGPAANVRAAKAMAHADAAGS